MAQFAPFEYFDITKINDEDYLNKKHIISTYFSDSKLYLLKYIKDEIMDENTKTLGQFRSLITDGVNIVCFSPPKAVDTYEFDFSKEYIIEQFEEGTMINMFYYNDMWMISTKTIIGAKTKFYDTSKKMFDEMFWDAFKEEELDIELFSKELCYSFVLKHPDNQIVNYFEKPTLKLCEIYKIYDNKIYVYDIKYTDLFGKVSVPTKFMDDTFDTINAKIDAKTYDKTIQGFVFKNMDGIRCKVTNPNFLDIQKFRGNQANLQYQYYKLITEDKYDDFCLHFPHLKQFVDIYMLKLELYSETLYEQFVSCYLKHEKPLSDYDVLFKKNMYQLHIIYKETGEKTTRKNVFEYVKHLQPALLVYLSNALYSKLT